MVIVYSAADFPPPATLSSRMARLLTKGWGALKDRGERARVRALLYGMEDRELKDLGFTRSEIESVTVIAWDSLDQATACCRSRSCNPCVTGRKGPQLPRGRRGSLGRATSLGQCRHCIWHLHRHRRSSERLFDSIDPLQK